MAAYILNKQNDFELQNYIIKFLYKNNIEIININNKNISEEIIYFRQKFTVLLVLNDETKYNLNNIHKIFYINSENVNKKLQELNIYYQKFTGINDISNVIVFDLDDTLIDENNNLLYNIEDLNNGLLKLKKYFKYIGIWSHGTSEHVIYNLKKNNLQDKFDFIMVRKNEYQNVKYSINIYNLLQKKFNIKSIKTIILVDDNKSNYIENDYSMFILIKELPNYTFLSLINYILKML